MNFSHKLAISFLWMAVLLLAREPVSAQPVEPELEPFLVPATSADIPLKSGDRIQITVVSFPELSSEQTVMPDGSIQLPMVGLVGVAGLTTAEAASRVTTALLPYVRRPQVSLTLQTPSPYRISITGEVLHPGPRSIPLTEQGESNSIKLSEALMAAGGITPDADLRNIVIHRQSRSVSSPGTNPSVAIDSIQVDLWHAIQTGDLSADPLIQDGDEIVVPAAVSGVNQQTLLSSTVAPTQIVVNVAGEVRQPGSIEIAPTADVSAAIAAAGGLTPDADADSIELFRMNESGQLSQEEFEFGEETTTIMNGDLIVVKKSSTSNFLDFIEDISGPIRLLFGIF